MAPPRSVDPRVWKACAGDADAAGFPAVGSVVFYFPQGHAEQASSPVDLSIFTHSLFHRCLVTAVELLSDPESEEMFSRVHLSPVPLGADSSPRHDSAVGVSGDGDGFMSSVKILTQSDAHNGGGFSVPKDCADSLFPPLDYHANTPAQKLSMCDVRGNVWEFRHIYRGKPPRHLLTTGWSNFVNEKSLIAGDSVIFMRSASKEELFIGVRRRLRRPINVYPIDASEKSEILGKGLWGKGRGRIPPSSVVDAVIAAKMNMPFEVLYYPGTGSPEFVVSEGPVNSAMEIQWTAGMRVKMSIENGVTGPQGTVKAVNPSFSSPWRMLQVIWDEGVKKSVSPWQVELVSDNHEQTPFPATKRLKVQKGQCLDGKESKFFPEMPGFVTSVYDVSPNCRTFPAGIQGARHDSYSVMSSDDLSIIETPQNNDVHTAMDSENRLQSRDSLLCIRDMNMNIENYKPLPSHPIKEVSGKYIKLFGNLIQIKQHIDNDANGMQGNKDGQIVHVASDTNEKRGNKDGHIDHVKEPVDNSADGYRARENGQTNQITLSGNPDHVDQPS